MVATKNLHTYSSVADLENLRQQYANCRYKQCYSDGKPRPCGSQRCPCEACRRKYAQKEAAILSRSFRDKPPDFNLSLRLTDHQPTTDKQLAGYLKRFTQKIRDFRKAYQASFEYYINIEFSNGQPHMHMTIMFPLDWSIYKIKATVKEWWSSSCTERQVIAVYCDHVQNVMGLANYLPKNLKDRRHVEMPPEGWNSRTCRLVWRSRGFLTKRKTDLWREQCQEWYPQPIDAQQPDDVAPARPILPADTCQERPARRQMALDAPRWAFGRLAAAEAANGAEKRSGGWFSPFVWLFMVKKPRGP